MNIRSTYDKAPVFIQECIGWCLRKHPRFNNQPLKEEFKYNNKLLETEYAPADKLRELQNSKLRMLIDHVSKNVPYYRQLFQKLGLKADDISTTSDLKKIPVLRKDIVQKNPESFLCDGITKKDLTPIATGGSTGTPMKYFFDKHMVGVRRATWWRWSKFAGVDLYKDKMIYCGGAPTRWDYPPESYRGIVNYTRRSLFLSSAVMSDNVLDRYIEDIINFKGEYIRGYASGIYLLARRVLTNNITIKMKAVLTSSDTLFPQYREIIEKAFNCSVYDHYGQNEDILTATECGKESGFHINTENCVAETIDENGEQNIGHSGRLISTHLENYSMPLLRYMVGDIGIIEPSWNKCTCGRYHQKLVSFIGRDDEIIITPEGRRVGCGSMNQPMKTMYQSMVKCQFIQDNIDTLTVKVVPAKNWNKTSHENQLIENVRKQVGNKIQIKIDIVDDIPSRKNGKYQFIMSHLKKA